MNAPLPAPHLARVRLVLARVVAPAAAGSAIVLAGFALGAPGVLLGIAAAALGAVILLLWWSVQSLGGATPVTLDEALTLAAPSAEEERKTALLRALRDLEYERSVGKIGEADYFELSARYRAEAKAVLGLLDESRGGALRAAEHAIEERLRKAEHQATPPDEVAEPDGAATDDADELRPTRGCAACQARNDLDARFCKRCAAPMAPDGMVPCAACPELYAPELTACPSCGVAREPA